jgi:hypothetical protein
MNVKPIQYFAHLEDFVSCYVGPFDTLSALHAHVQWCQEVRGDAAELIEIVLTVPAGEDTITPEVDKAFDGTKGTNDL